MQTEDEYEGNFQQDGDFDDDDIFGAPPKAINFTEELTPGERYRFRVLEKPRLIQGIDIRTKKPAKFDDGAPKMVGVTVVEFEGEKRSLWAPKSRKPHTLFAKMSDASRTAGASIRPEGVLEIEYLGVDNARKQPGQNAPHSWGEVIYEKPV